MADTNLRELQLAELDILKEFVRICDKHKLLYYLGWGSCLGAVRHNGFIPWDDDIDVLMPYEDFKKFKEICKNELDSKYFYQDMDTDSDFFYSFAKLRANDTTFMLEAFSKIDIHWGINIDIFPLYDYADDVDVASETFSKKIKFYRKLLYKNAYTKRRFYKAKSPKEYVKIACRCLWYYAIPSIYRKRYIKKVDDLLNDCKGTHYVDIEDVDVLHVFHKDDFGEGVLVPFEDILVRIPKEYDKYLKTNYGNDYMEVPKAGSDKIYYHEGVIIDLDQSYKNYKVN